MNIVARDEWGAEGGVGTAAPAAKRVVIAHHAVVDLPATATPEEEAEKIRNLEHGHITPKPEGRGFVGIAYNFLIAQSGRCYEGRGWGYAGAHARGRNMWSVGVCFLIDGGEELPTPEAAATFRELLNEGIYQGHLYPHMELLGHRDVAATECPGDLLYDFLPHLEP